MLPALRYLSDLELGELRRRLHREMSGASSGVEFALSAFCVTIGDEQSRRDSLPLRTGCDHEQRSRRLARDAAGRWVGLMQWWRWPQPVVYRWDGQP
jgi:hypothetical protein